MDFSRVLIVSDYDLTLTGPDHRIPEANLTAIRAFTARGGAFAIGSGRGMSMLVNEISKVPVNAPCVLSNGSVIYDYREDKTLFLEAFSEAECQRIIRIMEEMDPEICMMMESGLDDYYMPEEVAERFGIHRVGEKNLSDEARWVLSEIVRPNTVYAPIRKIPAPWVKITFFGSPEKLEVLRERCEENGLNGQKSAETLYELQPSGLNKGTGARKLAGMLGRDILVCAGDEDNDLTMLYEADYAFVPESAKPSMKERGFCIVERCEEGTLADVIRKLELMEEPMNKEGFARKTEKAEIRGIAALTDFVNDKLEAMDCPMKVRLQIDVALDEILSNIVHYAYDGKEGEMSVMVMRLPGENGVRIRFLDEGEPFNPLLREDPDVTLEARERRIGGLGIYIVKKTMDDVSYVRENGKNRLDIVKKW